MSSNTAFRRVAIIGAGPSGLAVARALFHDPVPFHITVFESRARPGGVWVYSGRGPVYRDLDTNIFKELMEYRDVHFPANLPTYPNREDVLKYIESYYQHITKSYPQKVKYAIKTSTVKYARETEIHEAEDGTRLTVNWSSPVTNVIKTSSNSVFQIETAGSDEKEEFDFVVVASGHFEKPLLPEISGLAQFYANHPSRISHTRIYDSPEKYDKQRILVVGNGSSGTDLLIQLRGVAQLPVHVSRRSEQPADAVFTAGEDVQWRPEISNINENGLVTFSDGTTDEFDHIVLATGYRYTLPFLTQLDANRSLRQTRETSQYYIPLLDPKELRVPNVHRYIFYIGDPRLAFVALNKNVVPMPLSECQGSVIARVFGGRMQLPPPEVMLEEEKQLVADKGDELGYFVLGYPQDAEYMEILNDWADQVPEGFHAERWGDDKKKLRARVAEAKLGDYARKLEVSRTKNPLP